MEKFMSLLFDLNLEFVTIILSRIHSRKSLIIV